MTNDAQGAILTAEGSAQTGRALNADGRMRPPSLQNWQGVPAKRAYTWQDARCPPHESSAQGFGRANHRGHYLGKVLRICEHRPRFPETKDSGKQAMGSVSKLSGFGQASHEFSFKALRIRASKARHGGNVPMASGKQSPATLRPLLPLLTQFRTSKQPQKIFTTNYRCARHAQTEMR